MFIEISLGELKINSPAQAYNVEMGKIFLLYQKTFLPIDAAPQCDREKK